MPNLAALCDVVFKLFAKKQVGRAEFAPPSSAGVKITPLPVHTQKGVWDPVSDTDITPERVS